MQKGIKKDKRGNLVWGTGRGLAINVPRKLGFKPGQRFSFRVLPKTGNIVLTLVEYLPKKPEDKKAYVAQLEQ